MTRFELNDIIRAKYGDMTVEVSELCYDEVEQVYLDSYYNIGKGLEKIQIGDLWMKFDYQGFRNIQEIIDNYRQFKDQVVDNVVTGQFTKVAPSQLEYLRLIGWNVKKLNLDPSAPWVA